MKERMFGPLLLNALLLGLVHKSKEYWTRFILFFVNKVHPVLSSGHQMSLLKLVMMK